MHDPRTRKTVYSIVEREGLCRWRPLGVGLVNADGSIDVKLDAVPQNVALRLHDAQPDARRGGT